ncbi:MAG: ribonuclease domain-containing protein [Clostridia bacterium]|nr:ribonuclease domain-containing protein [Clostridia bacterium]
MKKLLVLLFSVLMLFSFTACDFMEDTVNELKSELESEINNAVEEYGEELDRYGKEIESEISNAKNEIESDLKEAFGIESDEKLLDENGSYNSKEDVALYIHQYGKLPSNYITKKEAEKLGWSGGSVEKYAPGKAIGGSRFGNYEEELPDKKGRTYTECDIDTIGKNSRGAKRIVFSNDGLVYYTEDHYETFELLYGEP